MSKKKSFVKLKYCYNAKYKNILVEGQRILHIEVEFHQAHTLPGRPPEEARLDALPAPPGRGDPGDILDEPGGPAPLNTLDMATCDGRHTRRKTPLALNSFRCPIIAEVYLGCGKHHRNSSLESSCRKKLVAIASCSKAAEKYLSHCLLSRVAKQSIVNSYLNQRRIRTHF